MPLKVTSLDLGSTIGIGALKRQFHYESPDRNIWPETAYDSQITEWTVPCQIDTLLTEEIVAARRLNCIDVDIKADRTDPSIV